MEDDTKRVCVKAIQSVLIRMRAIGPLGPLTLTTLQGISLRMLQEEAFKLSYAEAQAAKNAAVILMRLSQTKVTQRIFPRLWIPSESDSSEGDDDI